MAVGNQTQEPRREGDLERKWNSYSSTGVNAFNKRETLTLRRAIDGREFAVVKLYGSSGGVPRLEVIEEVATSELETAEQKFDTLASGLGFTKPQPKRLTTT
jgi:hypothetical protein